MNNIVIVPNDGFSQYHDSSLKCDPVTRSVRTRDCAMSLITRVQSEQKWA